MNKRRFRLNVLSVIGVYILALALGVALRFYDPWNDDLRAYSTFKDLLLLIVAIPAAWLGYCFQRRQAYFKDVRDLWSELLPPVQDAIQYTHLSAPEQPAYGKVMRDLSIAIEEVRGVFANVGEAERRIGLYPFEGLKAIANEISGLGFGNSFTVERARESRGNILLHWKNLRKRYLLELPRDAPARPDSPFVDR